MVDRLTAKQKLDIAVFVLKTKTESLFMKKGSGLHNTMRILAVITAVLLGLMYGLSYAQLTRQFHNSQMMIYIKISLGVGLMMLTFVRSYFPSYKSVSFLVDAFYPAGRKFKTAINFIYDLYEPMYIYYLIFLAVFTATASGFGIRACLLVLGLMLSAIVIDRSIRIQIDHAVRNKSVFMMAVFFFIACLGGFLYWISTQNNFAAPDQLILLSVYLVALISFHMVLGNAIIEEKIANRRLETDRNQPGLIKMFYRMYIRNTNARQKFVLLILIKVIFMLVVTLDHSKGSSGSDMLFLYRYIIWTPIMVFTYIHNNYYGFFPNMWTSQRIYGDRFNAIFRNYLLSLVPPVAFDLILTVLISIYPGWVTLPDLCYYFSVLILLAPIGFYVSLIVPKPVEHISFSNIRGNTSQAASFLLLFCLVPFAVAIIFSWYWILLLSPVTAIVLFKYARRCYLRKADSVFCTIAK